MPEAPARPPRAAVALTVWSRPLLSAKTLAVLRQVRPERLFLLSDGPRPERPGEAARVAAARALFDDLGWPCRCTRRFAAANVGPGQTIEEGLDEAFAETDRVIFLEDDCVPHPDFFPFAETLLERYRDDPRVGLVSAFTPLDFPAGLNPDYCFSRFGTPFAIATWRRVWSYHRRLTLGEGPAVAAELGELLRGRLGYDGTWQAYRDNILATRRVRAWDIRLFHALWRLGALTIRPRRNLVSHEGLGAQSLHNQGSPYHDYLPTGPLPVRRHPARVEAARWLDRFVGVHFFSAHRSRLEVALWHLFALAACGRDLGWRRGLRRVLRRAAEQAAEETARFPGLPP